jgi:hypothetical protein
MMKAMMSFVALRVWWKTSPKKSTSFVLMAYHRGNVATYDALRGVLSGHIMINVEYIPEFVIYWGLIGIVMILVERRPYLVFCFFLTGIMRGNTIILVWRSCFDLEFIDGCNECNDQLSFENWVWKRIKKKTAGDTCAPATVESVLYIQCIECCNS